MAITQARRSCREHNFFKRSRSLARPNFSFQKHQKEMAKKKKNEEKKQRKLEKSSNQPAEDSAQPPAGEEAK